MLHEISGVLRYLFVCASSREPGRYYWLWLSLHTLSANRFLRAWIIKLCSLAAMSGLVGYGSSDEDESEGAGDPALMVRSKNFPRALLLDRCHLSVVNPSSMAITDEIDLDSRPSCKHSTVSIVT